MKYQINPITVDAIQIAGVGDRMSDGSIRVLLEGQGPSAHGTVIKRFEMMGTPKIGDYLVTNEDGTRLLVPRAPFEATHTRIEEPKDAADDERPDDEADEESPSEEEGPSEDEPAAETETA